MTHHRKSWTTYDEKQHVKGLGTFRCEGMAAKPQGYRQKLLKAYIKALSSRDVCDNIDRDQVLKFAMKELI